MYRYFSRLSASLIAALLAIVGLTMATQAVSASFTPGNIVVYRLGDGSAALTNAATAVFLDEYTPSGTLVQSIPLPTAVAGAQRRLTGSGTSTSDGLISRSADGGCILVAGYDAALGTTSVTGTTSAVANRIIGVVRADGTADTSTVFASNYSANNFRSAASTNCTDLWAAGGTDGVRYTTIGGTTNTQVSSTVTNLRQINIAGGQLYVSTGSGSTVRLGTVGTGTPTAAAQTITQLPGLPTTGSPYSFFFADLSAGVSGVDTLYVADEGTGAGLGLQKYSLVGGTWVANGSISGTGIRGLTGVVTGNSVALYAVNVAGALVTVIDATGYNATVSGAFTNVASAGTNRIFRGVALVPVAIATQADLTVSVAGPTLANVGVNYNYGVTLSNIGGTSAAGFTAQFTLPPGVTYVTASSGSGFTPSQSAGVVTWSGGTIAASGSVSLTVTVNAAASSTITLPVGAGVIDPASAVTESNEANNSSSTSVTTNVTAAGNTAPTIGAIPALSATISDTTNPTVTFTVSDAETLASALTVTVISSTNTAVVPLANVTLMNANGTVTASIIPAAVGFSDLTIQVSDGTLTSTQVLKYAASAASVAPITSRYQYGSSDASTAIALDANFMIVADDENQVLRVYSRQNSGYPVATFDYTSSLGLTDLSGGLPREVDIEAATRVGNRIYWLGSHSNSSGGALRPNRYRLFATDVTGTGAATSLTFVGYYTGLRTDLSAWDSANGHGLGTNFFGLTASAATGVIPEATDGSGFNIEGLVMAPDNTTAYIAFRAPQTVPGARTKALIVPVTNFASLVGGSPATGPATFGAPIQLDLGGRGIREIQKNASNQYIIIAGPADVATGTAPKDFVLYTWDGNAVTAPQQRAANLTALNSGGSFESIVEVPASLTASSTIQIISDNGDTIYYNDGTIAKDLAESRFKKARSDSIALGNIILSGITAINAVQGSGTSSTLTGLQVTIEGIVIANYQGTNQLSGFFIEAPDAEQDGNPATSEGIFVLTSVSPVTLAVGDRVRVSGTVAEFGTAPNTSTQLTTPTVTILSSGNALPTALTVSLPTATAGELERYEGMRVVFTQSLTVSNNDNLTRFGELVLSSTGRLNQPSNIIDPNDNPASGTSSTGTSNVAAITARNDLNARSTIILDDASTVQYPYTIPFWDNTQNTLRLGTTVANLTGVLSQSFGTHRVFATSSPAFNYAQRPLAPPAVGGNVKVASMNVLNYFNGPTFPTSRGADTAAELTRQRAKMISSMTGIGADVLALSEVENDGEGAQSAIQDIVNGLNTAQGAGTWAFVSTPNYGSTAGGTDEIKTAIVYKTTVVAPAGASVVFDDPSFSVGRSPVYQTFRLLANNEQFSVVVNHFKSKSSSGATGADVDQNDGQAAYNARRKLQATALVNLLAAQTNNGRVLAVGDFNAYGEEDPIDILRASGLVTLINGSYSYAFNGLVGALDHAFATSGLASLVTGADEWHINADEPEQLDYNQENKSPPPSPPPGCTASCQTPDYFDGATPFRASDHDPLLVGLSLKAGQTITFGVLANRLNNEAPFSVSATTISPLTVLFASQTTAVCSTTGSNGSTVTLLSIGTCTIRASQAGDANFNPAASVDRSFLISSAPVVCVAGTFSATGNTPCTPASAGSFVASSGATSQTACAAGSFSSTTGATACTAAPAGSFVSTIGATSASQCVAGSFSAIQGTTSCTLAAIGSFVASAGASSQATCAAGTTTITTGQTSCLTIQTITFAAGIPTSLLTTAAPFTISATGGASGNPVTFSSLTSTICTSSGINGATITPTAAIGLCTIRANQIGNSNFTAASPIDRNVAIGAVPPPPPPPPPPPLPPPNAPTNLTCVTPATGVILCRYNQSAALTTNPINSYRLYCANETNSAALQVTVASTENNATITGAPTGRYACNISAQATTSASNISNTARLSLNATPLSLRNQFDIDGNGLGSILIRGAATGASTENKLSNTASLIGRFDGTRFIFTPTNDVGDTWNVLGFGDISGINKTSIVARNTIDDVRVDTFVDAAQSPTTTILRKAKSDWLVESITDLDGDGKADIVWRYMKPGTHDSGVVFAWHMAVDAGGQPSINEIKRRGGAPLNWTLIGGTDLDGDGKADLVWQSPTGDLRSLTSKAGRTWVNELIGKVPAGYSVMKLGDLNANGRGDIVFKDASGRVKVWLMDGVKILLDVDMSKVDSTWTFYAAGDFDGNGTMDIVWKKADGTLVVWLMNSTTINQPTVIDNAGQAPLGVVVE